jgi:hypothetical protein
MPGVVSEAIAVSPRFDILLRDAVACEVTGDIRAAAT